MTSSANNECPVLGEISVVDLCGSVASAYCGKLLRDFGAEVTNLESADTGHGVRGLREQAASLYLSANKRSVTYTGEIAHSQHVISLLEHADVVLADTQHTGLEEIKRLAPSALAVCLSWFGESGPYRSHQGSEGVIAGLIGLVRGIGPAEGPPLLPAGYPCQVIAGTTAFVAVMGQLLGRQLASSRPFTQIETSVLEAAMCLAEPGPLSALSSGESRERLGVNRFWPTFPASIYPCREGHLGITALTPSQWAALCELLGLQELGNNPKYQITLQRLEDADKIDALIKPKLLERTAHEWFLLGQEKRIPLATVPTITEILESEQFRERGAFCTIEGTTEDGAGSDRLEMPAVPFRLQRTPARSGGRAPLLGEHNPSSAGSTAASSSVDTPNAHDPPSTAPANAFDVRLPLSGVRIVDLGMGWAGPLATRQLADLGAEIIKVESCQYFDWWRGWEVTPEMLAERLYEKAPAFLTVNRNKTAITLDLTREAGRELLGRLIQKADALVENYAGSVLPKLGLGEDRLREWNPELVILTMPPFGASGAWRNFRAYGSTVEHASGLPHLQGKEGWPPTMQHVALGDPVAGMTGAAALLVALYHRKATGQGQSVDLSHVESLFPLGLHGFAEYAATGEPPKRHGSRRPDHSPCGVFPCRVDNPEHEPWLAIAVENDQQWAALRTVLCDGPSTDAQRQALLASRFETLEGRKQHEGELEELVARLSGARERESLVAALQAAGVAAAPVLGPLEVLENEHLLARGYWQWHERELVGSIPNPSAPFRFCSSQQPAPALEIRTPSPTLGEHNEEVLAGLLELEPSEIAALEREQIIGTEPVRKAP